MPAVITDTLRRQIARDFFEQFQNNTENYYVAISKSEQWDSFETVPTPVNNPDEIADFRNGMQAMKRVAGTSLVVPRNNWSQGTIYSQYDDTVQGYPTQPYYVKTDNNQVYVCLETGRDRFGVAQPSTIEPTSSNNDSFRLADGYVWKFLYTISAQRQDQFQSSNFMPVQKQGGTDSNSTGIELKQKEIQDSATPGEILSIIITAGGSGYTAAPSVVITSPTGSGASATAVIDSATGQVARVRMDGAALNTIAHGSGYTTANVSFTGGGGAGATARAVLAFSDSGVGADARVDLKTASIMFHTMLEGDDSDFIVQQDFRQVGLYKNPLNRAGARFTGTTANLLKKMKLSSIVTSFTKDKLIEGQSSGAVAYVDDIDSNEIYYHQSDDTGFLSFNDGEIIDEQNGTGNGVIDSAVVYPNVDTLTGDILYIDNRAPVSRSLTQAEDIKIILQF